jgi:hypothetical protein
VGIGSSVHVLDFEPIMTFRTSSSVVGLSSVSSCKSGAGVSEESIDMSGESRGLFDRSSLNFVILSAKKSLNLLASKMSESKDGNFGEDL